MGRSSVEDLPALFSKSVGRFGGLQPEISFEALHALKQLVCWSPLMSQFAANIVNLGNTGHTLTIDAANEAAAEAAMKRCNETAARLWPEGAGVDGLINQYFYDIAWSGACSSEDVVNFKGRRVERVAIVPVEQIRFDWDGENYQAYQLPRHSALGIANGGLIPLNAATYAYYALSKVGSAPYAKPPATAALEDLLGPYTDGRANLKAILKKYGLLGFAAFQVTAPKLKSGESDQEFNDRAKTYLGRVRDALLGNWLNGLLVMYRDQKLDFHNVTGSAAGVEKIWEVIESQIFSGLGMQPSLFGRVHSTTETFADVVWSQLDAQVGNMRRLPQRRMQRTYQLDLLLGGLAVNGVTVKFARTPSRNALKEAQAEQVKVNTELAKAKAGITSPDQCAQALGYDAAFDPELLNAAPELAGALNQLRGAEAQRNSFTAHCRFDRASQRYRFDVPQVVTVSAATAAVSQAKKKALTHEEIDALFERFVKIYRAYVDPISERTLQITLDTVRNYLQQVRLTDFADAETFANKLFEQIEFVHRGEWDAPSTRRVIRQASEEVYRYYRFDESGLFPPGVEAPAISVRFGGLDLQSLRFFEGLDSFYFSKYLNNNDAGIKRFFADEYIAQGGRSVVDLTAEQIEDIRAALGDKLKNVNDVNLERIVRGTVARTRNWAQIGTLNDGLIEFAKIVAVLDSRTSEICNFLNGKLLRVGVVHKAIERLSALSPGDYAQEAFESPTAKALRTANQNPDEVAKFFDGKIDSGGVLDDSLMAQGHGFPPYHVSCRSWLEGVV